MFSRRPPSTLVREYTDTHAMEKDARSLAKRGYRIAGTSSHSAFGLPTLRHGILHTRHVVTYQHQQADRSASK